MEYPGKAYEKANLKPGDQIKFDNSSFYGGFPNGAEVISPKKAVEREPSLSGDADEFVYIVALPDKNPNSIDGIVGPWLAENATLLSSTPSLSELKERNDSGGNDGKCVACNAELKAWSWNKFYCPVCEP